MLITEQCTEHLAETRAFADSIGLRDNLEEMLDRLSNFGHGEGRCYVYKDFAPYSFTFVVQKERDGEWRTWFNGGLIFHGPHDNGGDGGAPTYSVSLSPHHGWSIHT